VRSEQDVFTKRKLKPLLEAASRESGFSQARLLGPDRKHLVTVWRHAIWYVAHRKLRIPLAPIGAIFNRRDHTSILYGVRRIEGQIEILPNIEMVVARIFAFRNDFERRGFVGTGYPLKQVRESAKGSS